MSVLGFVAAALIARRPPIVTFSTLDIIMAAFGSDPLKLTTDEDRITNALVLETQAQGIPYPDNTSFHPICRIIPSFLRCRDRNNRSIVFRTIGRMRRRPIYSVEIERIDLNGNRAKVAPSGRFMGLIAGHHPNLTAIVPKAPLHWSDEKLALTKPDDLPASPASVAPRGGPPSPGLRPTSPRGGEVVKTKGQRINGFIARRS
jgi:hypothetical protein